MGARFLAAGSLRRKIFLGYAAAAALAIGMAVSTLIEMQVLRAQLADGERIGQLFALALEIRRFEKNYLLYREEADRQEALAYAGQARELLATHGETLAHLGAPDEVARLSATLVRHAELLGGLAAGDGARESELRQAGKQIVTQAETWARAERTLLQGQLARHEQWLLASAAVGLLLLVGIGHRLARGVVQPLGRLEAEMAAVAAGRLAKLQMPAAEREIASLTAAFNRVLDELAVRQGQLVRSEKLAALGTLLSGVAHEVNNPLSNISTSCELLDEELCAAAGKARDQAFEKELLEQIEAETWRARRIVRSLLDYARERPFHGEPLALAALAADTVRLMRGRLPPGVAIGVAIDEELRLFGDRQRLQQVLFNLLGNAADAVGEHGRIDIAARHVEAPLPAAMLVFGHGPRAGPAVEIEVADDGCGIAAADLPRIFDPFFSTKSIGRGSGLGLFVVFEIVEEHGAVIAVSSAPGAGSRFLIRFPHSAPAAARGAERTP